MNMRVLIVDDSPYMRARIRAVLESVDCTIVGEAETGEQAIDMALSLKPDLVTLDNILPDMVGLDVLDVLKNEEKLPTKIVMISAVGQESVIQKGIDLGAEDYIVKPFTKEQLVEKLEQVSLRELQ